MSKSLLVSTIILMCVLLICGNVPIAQAADISFQDVAADPASGIDYQRVPSAEIAAVQALQERSLTQPFTMDEMPFLPMEPHGMPGTAILDFDLDGDLDIFVTNGPGAPHSLFANQLAQTGTATFVDVAEVAGVGAAEMDGNGVCHGDLDNDGDPDLLVLGRSQANRLFENLGDGTFRAVDGCGLDLDLSSHISCTMGDVDGDGLLDIAVANAFELENFFPIFVVPFDLNQHNQLYLNNGDLTFTNVSSQAGLDDLDAVPHGAATISWAISMVDLDLDGDLDIIYGDDNGGIPTRKIDPVNGVDRGFIQILVNDGSGHFSSHAVNNRPESAGSWMGLGFGDLNCDGTIDIFGSNFGDYNMPSIGLPYFLGDQASRPLFGHGDGSFSDPGLGGDLVSSSFGWGNAIFDYDNDGDSDVLYHGGLDMIVMALEDNPGIILENRGCNGFTYDLDALGARHGRRNVHGVAIGDLDRNGFVDVVSVSNFVVPQDAPRIPSPAAYGGVLDAHRFFVPIFAPVAPGQMAWTGLEMEPGNLSIELNGGNGNGGVTVKTVGAVGLTDRGKVNRDGVGAVVSFLPDGGVQAMMPITAGASHVSAHAAEAYFGLGQAASGTLEVLWPGGARNRLYDVAAGETVLMPEIPCSFDENWCHKGKYMSCVARSLNSLARAGVISRKAKSRYLKSAERAFDEQ